MDIDAIEREADGLATRRDYASAGRLLARAVDAAPDRFELWLKLSAMRRAACQAQDALAALDRALALRPVDFTALLMRATQLHALGHQDEAGQAYGRALAQAPDNAPAALAPVLDTARRRYEAWQNDQATKLREAAPSRSPAVDRLITNAVRLTTPDRDGPSHYCYPDLPELAFHPREHFPWLQALEAQTDAIAAEFEALIASTTAKLVPYIQYPDTIPIDAWKALNHNRDWTAIHLVERGRVVPENASRCPHTMEALRAIPQPDIAGAGPNAMFSLLAPQTHIPPHTGITNTRLVCHLPLIVPPGCWFRVGEHRREWARGQAWVFDDTLEHEAMNPTGALRVVLIVDIWHPTICDADRDSIAAVIGAGGRVHGL